MMIAGCTQGLDYPAAPAVANAPAKDKPSGSTGSALTPSPAPDGGATAAAPEVCDMIRTQSKAILQANCAGCHEAPGKQGNFNFVLEVDKLKSSGLLVPGDPEASKIYSRIASGEMPPQGQAQRPSNNDATTIYQWIKVCTVLPAATPPAVEPDAGAPVGPLPEAGSPPVAEAGSAPPPPAPPVAPVAVPFIDNAAVSRWMASDITTIRLEDQKFQRYLSLVHVMNAGATSAQMDLYRYGMAKAVNALSGGTRVVAPRAIDQYGTVYRVDLRDLRWDASGTRVDKWELLVAANPYAIEYVDDSATVVKQLTRTRVPVQAGDWLVFAGMQPPLYHDVVGIPATLTELQTQLGTNINQDIARQEVWRSGFNNSGIAQLNRVLERHEIPAGGNRTLWISYDFAGNGGKENIFSNPLDFQSDASEVIFSLPNGLHAYMLVDGAGKRLDEGSDRVVVDRTQKNGNVINGISCISCHDGGIKFKKDEVRPFVDESFNFDARTKDIVDVIYALPDTFQTLVAQDSDVFMGQLQRLAPPATVNTEPVGAVFHKFEEDVNLKQAAAELGVTRDQLLTQLGRLDPTLAPLATGTIKRDTFRIAFAQSVCLLNIGRANNAACPR
jgi:mono/diheme cytochrome c family protein